MPAPVLVSFAIPAYNEAPYVDEVLRRVSELPLEKEVIAVDDGSSDGTWEVLRSWQGMPGVLSLRHSQNRGKGAALRTALANSRGDIVVVQDADLEYDPADVPRLIKPILDGHADVVFGSRLKGGQPQRAYMFWHLVGNRVLSLMTNLLFNTTLSDMETGYKAFRGDVARNLDLRSDDFRVEPEITAKVLKSNLRVYEVPIAYYGRTYAEGKKITWRDGIVAAWTLALHRFKRSSIVMTRGLADRRRMVEPTEESPAQRDLAHARQEDGGVGSDSRG